MNRNISKGKDREDLGATWLQANGYAIREGNWKYGRAEIDLIAEKNEELHSIEIKTRSNNPYGFPEEKISKNKLQPIAEAGEEYLQSYPKFKECILDALSITLKKDGMAEYYLIEDMAKERMPSATRNMRCNS
jgi:putative endonuclease